MNWGDNYPAVNQNGLNDPNLPQVKVKCVLKTTDRIPPLPINSFYSTEHHCAPLIFFSLLTRAPLGYFYNAPHWGGAISSPPSDLRNYWADSKNSNGI